MTAPLWTAQAIVEATGAERAGALPDAITGISIDSRSIKTGEAFFAIKGDTLDGHDFVAAALKAGADLAVVARDSCTASVPPPRAGEGWGGGTPRQYSRTGPLPDPPRKRGRGKRAAACRAMEAIDGLRPMRRFSL